MSWFWRRDDQDSFFQKLHITYYKDAYRAAWMITRDSFLAEDAVQEAFGYIAKKLKEERNVDNPGAWVVSMATRRAIDEIRKRDRSPILFPQEELTQISDLDMQSIAGPESHVEQAEVRDTLRELIGQLRPEYGQVIRLFYYHQKSESEIAQMLGVPLGTVKTWRRRATDALAKICDNDDKDLL